MKSLHVEVLRGPEVESTHQVDLIAVNKEGRPLLELGDINRSTFPRSAIKPIQAMLFASLGEPGSPADIARIALASASHWAEPIHLMVLEKWHGELGFSDQDLICGPQVPRDSGEQRRLILTDQPVRRLHNNCSGKHTAFLQYCRHKNMPTTNYGDFDHPLQIELRELLSQMSGTDWHQLPWGIDGCGIPASLVPLQTLVKLTSAFLRAYPNDDRVRRVVDSICMAPEMISGNAGLCTTIIRESGGEWLVKTGAEGNYLGMNLKSGVSFFLKVHDGGTRASEHAVLWACQELGTEPEFNDWLEERRGQPLVNWAGENIGHLRIRLSQSS